MLNGCSHDKSEAEATNDGQGVQEKATGGYPKITKAAKKRAAKRRGQARSKELMFCLALICILVWPTAVTCPVQRLRIISSVAARSLASCFVSPLLHHIAAIVELVIPSQPPLLSW